MGGQLREFGPGELEAMPAGEDNGHGATQGRRGLVAAKIDLDEAVFVLAVPSPVGIKCGDRQAVRGAELNPRLRAVFIMPEQLLNLRRRAALPVLGLLHPFSKPDSSLTGNQGVAHALTFDHSSKTSSTAGSAGAKLTLRPRIRPDATRSVIAREPSALTRQRATER